jgi:hypothetical protein
MVSAEGDPTVAGAVADSRSIGDSWADLLDPKAYRE